MLRSILKRVHRSSKLIIIPTLVLISSIAVIAQSSNTASSAIAVQPVKSGSPVPVSTPDGSSSADTNNSGRSSTAKSDSGKDSSSSSDDRLKALEKAMSDQNAKIQQMNQIIENQQHTIEQLSAKSTAGNTAGQSASTTANSGAGTNQSPTLADTIGKTIVNQTKNTDTDSGPIKIGPLTISGDFRLRLDAILRSSDTTPPAGQAALTDVQNVRARYRFRLNMGLDITRSLRLHAQLTTGPVNNPLTNDQDFTATVARVPFSLNEAYIEYHPNDALNLQGGRLPEIFADNSRFLFDDDVRFNGFNEKYVFKFKNKNGLTSLDFRAGQYIFSNPNTAIVTAGSPLATAGAPVGKIGRNSDLFHQGVLANFQLGKKWTQQIGGDLQVYRNPNQIQLASTATGVVFVVYPGLGLTLSGPISGTGNATTTSGGAIYTAPDFHVGRFTYQLNYAGFKSGTHVYPVSFNFQVARNFGADFEQNAYLASLKIGKVTKRNDMSFLYIFAQKGANSLISQLTDDDLGTNSGVNIRTSHIRFDYGISKNVQFQSLFFFQKELRNSGEFPSFFVPLNAYTPLQSRFQEQIVFSF